MIFPKPGDYIDVHTHGSQHEDGIFTVENLMANEVTLPSDIPDRCCTMGIHPWHLTEGNYQYLLEKVRVSAAAPNLVAVGEVGFDMLRGPSVTLQTDVFEAQVKIAAEHAKPVIIHCVRAWSNLLAAHKRLKPDTPWLVHGFRGKRELALQLMSRGIYISFWFDFVLRRESSGLIRSLPAGKMLLETDGADVDIRDIYRKVSDDLDIETDELKKLLYDNYMRLFHASA